MKHCPDPTTAEAHALTEALRLAEMHGQAAISIVFLTDCKSLLDLLERAEPRPRLQNSNHILTTFEARPAFKLVYLHRRCRRMRLVHHLANARRLEAELAAHHPVRRSHPKETSSC